jgi:uncharacterized protein HemX
MSMDEAPTDHFAHQEHAAHAANEGGFSAVVAITIAMLAVLAAGIGSLETIESGAAIIAKNEAVLHQNKATDQWNFFQARSIKRNMYEIAASAGGPKTDEYNGRVKEYEKESAEIQAKAKDLEGESEAALSASEQHEKRHHFLTLAATLLHISIAVATVAIISGGKRWPWQAAIVLGFAGAAVAATAYL